MRFSAALPAIFVALAAGDAHKRCECYSYTDRQGWHYDWQLTQWTCWHDFPKSASYDHGLGACIGAPRAWIDGARFETDCIQNGVKDGFWLFNPDGTPNTTGPAIKVGGAYSKCQYPDSK
ncbi:hypothetical protein E4U55_003801 [Claviceps digitariae]|nr:hypothetical protein E4U55_003801 [Claviceps digitariae]